MEKLTFIVEFEQLPNGNIQTTVSQQGVEKNDSTHMTMEAGIPSDATRHAELMIGVMSEKVLGEME